MRTAGSLRVKLPIGFAGRVLVEIKLPTNNKVVAGYSKQLARYKAAEETLAGYYLVIHVGQWVVSTSA